MDKSGQGTNIMAKVSACMMVKNEEEMLPRCLSSIKDFVDEIIIVDTGSTDRSKEIAREFGAKVYDHPWDLRPDGTPKIHFSTGRNLSLGYASYDWVLIIDADEELILQPGATFEKVKRWLGSMPSDGVAGVVKLHDVQGGAVVMEMPTARLYRKGSVHYLKSVHNQPQVQGNGHFCPFLTLNHYGYGLSPEKMEAKFERSKRLLLERWEEDKTDYLSLFYLCELFANRGKPKEAAEFAEEYLKYKEQCGSNFCSGVFYTAAHTYIQLRNFQRAEEWVKMGLDHNRDDLDLCFTLLELGVVTQNRDKVFIGGRKYLKLFNAYQRNPGFNGGNFIFTTNVNSFCFVVYNLIVNEMAEGYSMIGLLEKAIAKASPEYAMGILSDLKRALEPFGIQITASLPSTGVHTNQKPVGAPNQDVLNKIMMED